jgi:holo-[acyl-carrier protein] synthase
MIIGIGSDLVHIPRMEELIEKHGDRIAERILTEHELSEFQMQIKPAAYLAKRFAAKEAASKAFGTGFRNGLSLRHIGVINNSQGQPVLSFTEKAIELKQTQNIGRCFLTISDDHDYATAFVVMTDETE